MRVSLFVAAMLSAFLWSGCGGGDDNPVDNKDNNGTNNGGGSYESVKIGSQTWMKKNLNIETANSWCYDNSPDSCAKYGRLYTWNAAKTACPTGWKLPDTVDWNKLITTAGGTQSAGRKLKAASGWNSDGNGTDESGFSALPGGYGSSGVYASYFYSVGEVGEWWTATESGGNACSRDMRYTNDRVGSNNAANKETGHSVRCIKQ